MHPDYQHRMEVRRGGEALRFRATPEERDALTEIISIEGGTLTELVVEGLWRVVENRQNDPQYQAAKDEISALEARLEAARANLHSSE